MILLLMFRTPSQRPAGPPLSGGRPLRDLVYNNDDDDDTALLASETNRCSSKRPSCFFFDPSWSSSSFVPNVPFSSSSFIAVVLSSLSSSPSSKSSTDATLDVVIEYRGAAPPPTPRPVRTALATLVDDEPLRPYTFRAVPPRRCVR